MQRATSPGPDRSLRGPKLRLPAGAWDTHVHIFGPQTRFPLAESRKLDVEDCTLDDLVALHDTLGFSRALLVQSFQHGCSYEYMLHALSREPKRFRGVTMLAPDVTDAELDILTHAGVIAARFAYRASPRLDTRMIARVHELGWQAHFMLHGEEETIAWGEQIAATSGRFVIEHSGWPPIEKGIDSAAFRFVLACLDTGRCWVKLSPRYSKQKTLPFSDVLPFIRALVARAPNRLLWGSDWPHPNYFDPMPNDADLLDLMLDWVPDEATQHRIFVDNPAELFGAGL
jgi:2-pyrone-4,6-dicarboxylate lactonase